MDELLKVAKLDYDPQSVTDFGVSVHDLYSIVNDGKPRIVDRIQKALPTFKLFDWHRLKAVLQDMKKSGKINAILEADKQNNSSKDEQNSKNGKDLNSASKTQEEGKEEPEVVTPNKVPKSKSYIANMDSLRNKRRKPISSFKRREALNKQGWGKENNQMTMDKFLIPRRKKKTENTSFMMMDCSDSYSWMPSSNVHEASGFEPKYKSKKRINKLMGKNAERPLTRSRLASRDFGTEDDWSCITTLQELKKKKKSRLEHLKSSDMMLMSAWDEDSALSVQHHITRKYRKRKAIPLNQH